ncbi:MAG: hypothetical protein ABSG84_14625 [Acidobacteriaceae bacterium]|jgi:hypothetical protein
MTSKLHFTLLLALAALLGCGSSPTPTTPPASTYLNLTGNWLFSGNANASWPISQIQGALQSSDGAVTGTLLAFAYTSPAPCISATQPLSASGTLSTGGDLVLTFPIAGGTATVTAALTSDLQQLPTITNLTNGTWQIVGGDCAMSTTPIFLTQFAPATGTYTGTLNEIVNDAPVPGTATNVTAVLTQSTTPTADGVFPLNGTVTATGACVLTITFTDGTVNGPSVGSLPFDSPPVTYSIFGGGINPTATTLSATLLPFNTCGSQFYNGTLTLQ